MEQPVEQLKAINRYYQDDFMICDAHSSHLQILFRNSKFVEGANVNTELVFKSVEYMEIPTTIERFHITNGDKDDWDYIKAKVPDLPLLGPEHYCLFRILCNNIRYYIVAATLQIQSNKLGALDRSL